MPKESLMFEMHYLAMLLISHHLISNFRGSILTIDLCSELKRS